MSTGCNRRIASRYSPVGALLHNNWCTLVFSGINMAIDVMLNPYKPTRLLRLIMEQSLMCFVNGLLSMKFLFCTPLSVVMYMIELDETT